MNPRERINILLVDDQPAKLLSYEAILEELGENLIKANSGREALEVLLRTDVTVVLMDVSMPELDGFELAELIHRHPRFQKTAIIFVSAVHLSENDRLRGYESGAVDYVSVPVVPQILRAKVRVFAELYRRRQETERLNRELEERVAQRTAQLEAFTAKLRESEERFRLATEAMRGGIYDWDLERGVVDRSAGLLEILGADKDETSIRDDWWTERIHPEDRQAHLATVRNALEGDAQSYGASYRTRHKNGTWVWVWDCGRIVRDAQGHAIRVVGHRTDVTAQKLAEAALRESEERLREADRRKDEFLALLAHELRNPLAPVRNAVQIMRLKTTGDSELTWCRQVIERQVNQLARLVDDLLDVSRITRGKIKLYKEPVQLASVISEAVETSRPLIDSRRHQLIITIPDHAVQVDGDLARLTQIVANLLNNAAKYQDEGGRIALNVRVDNNQVVIGVKDWGVGIASDRIPAVFDLFAQEEAALDRAHGGLGIGLWLVRNLVQLHGGTVQAFSDGPNQGSEFVVKLPCVAVSNANVNLDDLSQEPVADVAPMRILVVDDNPDVAESLSMLLRFKGHDVTIAYDGRNALKITAAEKLDAVFLDIGLPGIDGYEVCRRMRQQGHDETLIVALTGYGQEKDRQRSHAAGFDTHAVKPVELATLIQLLATKRANEKEPVVNSVP
jgi:PAS domain S-box-containing protein